MNRQNRDEIKGMIRRLQSLAEVAVLSLAFYGVWRWLYNDSFSQTLAGNGKYVLMLVYALLTIVIFAFCDCFKYGRMKVSDIAISQCISVVIVDFISYFQLCLMANTMVSFWPILMLLLIDIALCIAVSWWFSTMYHRLYAPKNMLMIYGIEKAVSLTPKMNAMAEHYRVRDLISINAGARAIQQEIEKHDGVIINDVPAGLRNDILKYCYEHRVSTYVVPKISDIIVRGAQSIDLFDTPLLRVNDYALTPVQRATKRVFDLVLCSIALIPSAPIMLIIAAAIKLEDHGPVFYKQERVTQYGRRFEILKFRSMIVDAEKDGRAVPATGKDPRITRVGSVIRALRVDELPQLLNILKGDMSIVGPRPERVEHVQKYLREIPEFDYRLQVKGGLTGYAQVFGKYNTSAYDKLRMDLIYIENYSILLDIRLILMTIRILFKKESTEGFDQVLDDQAIREILKEGDVTIKSDAQAS